MASERLIDSRVDVQVEFLTREPRARVGSYTLWKRGNDCAMIHLSRHVHIITPVRHDKAHPGSPPYGIPTEFHLTLKVWRRENIAVARAE